MEDTSERKENLNIEGDVPVAGAYASLGVTESALFQLTSAAARFGCGYDPVTGSCPSCCDSADALCAVYANAGWKGSGGPYYVNLAIIFCKNASGLASATINLTKAVLFSSSVNLKSLTCEYVCEKMS